MLLTNPASICPYIPAHQSCLPFPRPSSCLSWCEGNSIKVPINNDFWLRAAQSWRVIDDVCILLIQPEQMFKINIEKYKLWLTPNSDLKPPYGCRTEKSIMPTFRLEYFCIFNFLPAPGPVMLETQNLQLIRGRNSRENKMREISRL